MFEQTDVETASTQVNRLCNELDITNADHIALYLNHWITSKDDISFVAVRIAEAAASILSKDEAWAALRSLESNPMEARSDVENSAVEKLDAIYRRPA